MLESQHEYHPDIRQPAHPAPSASAFAIPRRSVLTGSASAAAVLGLGSLGALAQSATSFEGELTDLTLAEASRLVQQGQVSPVDLTQACLARIERLNPLLNAFITVAGEQALVAAREAEREIRAGGWRGPLHGIPIGLKDNMDTAGIRSTGASAVFENRVPAEDSEVARRLKEAGAVLLGKLNLNEFAYGGSATVSHFGTMHNPWDLERATGGSSGGSGAAVAAGLCFGALGTDTAGSVRMPASHCGIVGLKPTYGRVSARGVMMLSWTLDHVGPMCRTVEDVALMLEVIAGYDPLEPTTSREPVPDYRAALGTDVSRLRIGVPREPYFNDLHPEVERAVSEALTMLSGLGAGMREVSLPRAISGARLWGPEAYAWHLPYFSESPEKYQPGTRTQLERSANAEALDYVQARREVDLLRQSVGAVFEEVDVLVTPILRQPAPLLSEGGGGGPSANAADFDVFGLPAISVPCGFASDTGMPIGVQIVGAHFAEPTVLALADAYERVAGWRGRRPEI